MKQIPVSISRQLVALALAGTLAACGGGDDAAQGKEAAAKTPDEAATAVVKSPEDARMANAVATGKTSAPVDLKFDVLAKPAAGQPFEIELAFLPRLAADTLEVEVTGIAGLTVASGGAARFEGVTAGSRHVAKVTVQADADGIYYVNVVARMVTKVQSEARTFAVPVVVGTVAPAQKAEPVTDAAGEAIQPMPAAETGGKQEPGQQ
jgi:hypothetical protein